jgi:cob(I)alamin adenosyltransferase
VSITTKNGDRGTTRLYTGEEVSKDEPRIDFLGLVDELVSALGMARSHSSNPEDRRELIALQKMLFVVASEVATFSNQGELLPRRVGAGDVRMLEERMAELERTIPMPGDFILPGGSPCAACLDYARAKARSCERRAVALQRDGQLDNQDLMVWLNRISDYLWLLARHQEDKPLLVREA